jgi:hypothetical protein
MFVDLNLKFNLIFLFECEFSFISKLFRHLIVEKTMQKKKERKKDALFLINKPNLVE